MGQSTHIPGAQRSTFTWAPGPLWESPTRPAPPHGGTLLTQEIIKNGATDVVVMGGDGTLHEVINGFSDFGKVNLGLIPCGTGNDFACALKLPKDPVKALDLIIDGTPKYTDYFQNDPP